MKNNDEIVEVILEELITNPPATETKKIDIINKLFKYYLSGVDTVNRTEIAEFIGENQSIIDNSKEMNLYFINDKDYMVRCEGYENIQYDNKNYDDFLLERLTKERHAIAKHYLYTAIRFHINEKFYNIFKTKVKRTKKPDILFCIYRSIMEYEDNYQYFDNLLKLFYKAEDPYENYRIFKGILDFKLPKHLRVKFLNELKHILNFVNPEYGFSKDLKKYIELLSNNKSWKNSTKRLSILHITGDH